jgi:glutamyl-tRNA synthetase
MNVFVRIAPSPTGLLHIGNVRAALFNYLFARRHGGTFMLRLDDTDRERSTPEFAKAIEQDLAWLGLAWDAFARQSDRLKRYAEALDQLKAAGRVYPCFETQAELDLKRKTQLGRGLPPVYDRAALNLAEADRARLMAEGRKPHWRFKLNHTDVVWDDIIQKHKTFPASSLSDPVLVREDGVPLYTFCSVVDDADFGVTHVIRGEDHVTNTAVQIQIWEAVTGKPIPQFAHFPLLVSSENIEMSKRLGTLSIASMRDELEIEPMAILSLLAKLGTSDPVAPRLRLDELVAEFDLAKISRATPKFDLQELKILSAKVLHMTPFGTIAPRLREIGLKDANEAFWNAIRTNLMTLNEAEDWWKVVHGVIEPRIEEPVFIREALALLPPEPWNDNTWETWTQALKTKTGKSGKDLFQPLRLALTASLHGPEMKNLLHLIGRPRAEARLKGEKA